MRNGLRHCRANMMSMVTCKNAIAPQCLMQALNFAIGTSIKALKIKIFRLKLLSYAFTFSKHLYMGPV